MKKRNYTLRFTVLSLCFAVVLFLSLWIGRYALSFSDVLNAVKSVFSGDNNGGYAYAVMFNVRLPRVLAAALIGGSLSVAGNAYQAMFKNPMASPDILGASSGAGFGAALAILFGFSYFGITVSSFVFGICAVLVAFLVSRISRTDSTLAIILAGIMISSLFSAATSFVKLVADTQSQLPAITYWLMGSLSSVKKSDVLFASIPIVVGTVPLFLLSWRINLLTTSREQAKSLGVNVRALTAVVIFCATLITAASVSISGMIGWVGLVIPHFCRTLFGYDCRRTIPACALMGGAFLTVVDDIARTVTVSEIPIGILTAFVGAPVFIYMILKGGDRHEY